METEKKYSMIKFLLLPVIVFLVMQYQIDSIKAKHAAQYYHERIQDVQGDIYQLELKMVEQAQLFRKELDRVFFEINKEGEK
jgi:hypothetical protein